jgi:predicted ATPase
MYFTIVVHVEFSDGTMKYMVEPVTLEAYRDTKLLFWVERDTSKH